MKSFEEYLNISKAINGWFDQDAARIFYFLNNLQREEGLFGNIFEIGVHHGKSALLLGIFIDPKKHKLIVNDIFDQQELNISNSGLGSKEIFKKNYLKFFNSDGGLQIIEKPSRELSVGDTSNSCIFFSIDGGHSADETYNDLLTAKNALLNEGIIAVDDYFNAGFPGVSEGVCRFLIENEDFVPWIYCFNKLIIIKKTEVNNYKEMLVKNDFENFCKDNNYFINQMKFFENDLMIFRKRSSLNSILFNISNKLKKYRLFKKVAPFILKIFPFIRKIKV